MPSGNRYRSRSKTNNILSNCLTLLFFIGSTVSPNIKAQSNDTLTTLLKQIKPSHDELDPTILKCDETQPSLFVYSSVPGARPKPRIANSKSKCMLIVHLLIISCGDIETNPGPLETKEQSFPCAICMHDVSWSADALQCDGCDLWQHRDCIGISLDEYNRLGNSPSFWICGECGLRNISTSIFNSHNSTYSNSDRSNRSLASITSPGDPLHCSSPIRQSDRNTSIRKNTLSILNVNCQSIRAKRESFHIMVNSLTPDIIIGTESWLSSNDLNSQIFPTQYTIERRDRTTSPHGGVFIAVKSCLAVEREYELETNCEIIWCKIQVKGSKVLHVGALYRPHEGDEQTLTELETSLARIGNHGEQILLGGDFNLPGWNWNDYSLKPNCRFASQHHKFRDIIENSSLTQLVVDPTRGSNTLDLLLTNTPAKVSKVTVAPGISDHNCPIAELDVKPTRRTQTPRKVPIYKKANWEEFERDLKKTKDEINGAASTSSATQLWNKFKDAILDGIENHIPTKHLTAKDSLPYITPDIIKLIKRRDRLYKNRKRKQRRFDFSTSSYKSIEEKLRNIKREIQLKTRRAYWKYIESIITPLEPENNEPYSNMKRFWAFIKHNRKDYSGVPPLNAHGKHAESSKEKANLLNEQFESVFTNTGTEAEHEHHSTSDYPCMENIEITENGVLKLLNSLKVHKAAGPDKITARVLKQLASVISPILTTIYKRSYETGEIPQDWRSADITPVYKKGKKSDPANYRPISLTSIPCKLLEHIVTSAIMKHGKQHNILYDLQHGFRDKRSCESQLIGFIDDVVNAVHGGNQTDVIVMDFSKAFDKVSHCLLVDKLRRYGIQGHTNRWIRNWLSDRKQTVVLDGERSYTASVRSGVPQGSVLGPCLFLYYINDIPENVQSKVRLFADDTIMYLAFKDKKKTSSLQKDLDKLAEWESKWQMAFHPEKCQVISISRRRSVYRNKYYLHGHILSHVDSAKYLGVTITSDLNWNKHIDNITRKANNTLSFLKRNLQINNTTLKATAYQTLVRPQVEYASSVWDPYTKKNVDRIEMIQHRAARYVLNRYNNTSSVTNMLTNLKWQTLEQRRKAQRLTNIYKIRNGQVILDNHETRLIPVHSQHRTSHGQRYDVPFSRANYHRFSYVPRTIREWNALPSNVVSAPNLNEFKRCLSEAL